MNALLTTRQVAAVLGVPLDRLHRVVRRLRAEHGFPRPLPHMGGRYDPIAIEGWRHRMAQLDVAQGDGAAVAQSLGASPSMATPAADDVAGWQAELDARAAKLGRAAGAR